MADDPVVDGEGKNPLEGGWDAGNDLTLRAAFVRLLHPVPLTVLLILLSVLALIGANVFGWDSGKVLSRMADHEFARGLITYLFAVTTIGTAVVLLLAALMGRLMDHAYQRAKEILALLLGVFGTIVGFYFGSEAHAGVEEQMSLAQPLLSATTANVGDSVRLTGYVRGGIPPYSWAVTFGKPDALEFRADADQAGWITTSVVVPTATSGSEVKLVLGAKDSMGQTATRTSVITVRPP